jgi:hypothetical protein
MQGHGNIFINPGFALELTTHLPCNHSLGMEALDMKKKKVSIYLCTEHVP